MTRITPDHENEAVVDYWLEHYVNMHCSLCGNSGVIDTTHTAVTAGGVRVGRINFCICPNGQAKRAFGCVPVEIVRVPIGGGQ